MPTRSESRETVSGESWKVVELLRKRLRLSLGAMMIMVVGLGGVLSWVAQRAHVQRDAVAAITTSRQNTRGRIYYDWQFVAGTFDPNAKPRGPKWLRDALGPDVFDTVVIATIEGDNVDDEFLKNVGKLQWLEKIDLVGRSAPDLTLAGMSRLWTLPRLKTLNTRRGIAIPRGFVNGLAGMTELRNLWLPEAAVTDDELAIIGSLINLETLQVDGTNITDQGFAHLANLKKLTLLDVEEAELTDSSVDTLAGFPSLDRLNIRLSRISPAGVKRLKQALPKANISWPKRPGFDGWKALRKVGT